MSRFESSRFARNSNVMNAEVLQSACDALGWKYEINDSILTISDAHQVQNMYGEYVLQLNLLTNKVSYNTYYTPDARVKVEELQNAFINLMQNTHASLLSNRSRGKVSHICRTTSFIRQKMKYTHSSW